MPDRLTPPPAPELLQGLDDACDAFDGLWQQGSRPDIEDHLGSVPDTLRPLLLEELVRTELEWRWRRGETPAPEEYLGRFPGCAGVIESWLTEARSAAEMLGVAGRADANSSDNSSAVTRDDSPPATPDPASALTWPPVRVLGEYELLEKLGAGGMGVVYKARHRRLDRLVALKLLPPRPDHSERTVDRFLREMRAAGSVDHPNVVDAQDAGESDGIVYLAMKLIVGTDLARLVKERGPLPVGEACDAMRQVALGLAHLAERGLVHRDIKPSNLMRTPEGVVKILDLGLARWRAEYSAGNDLTVGGQTLGTPEFLAPEQLDRAAEVDTRADLYGLGGTLYFLLTGTVPFADRHGLFAKLEAVKRETPPAVRSLRPEVPPALAILVKRLLAKKPSDRPQTPEEVAAALAAFSAGAVPALPPTVDHVPPGRVRAGRWRGPAAAGLAALAGLALTGLGAWQLTVTPRPPGDIVRGVESRGQVPRPISAEAPRVVRLDVVHSAKLGNKAMTRGLLGRDSFATHRGDGVDIRGELSQPAYAYLIAFRPDGTEEVCFPDSADEAPPLSDRPRFPSKSQVQEYGLDEGDGLEVFALVASSKPLPAYREWRSRLGASPWTREPALEGVVWRYDGSTVDGLSESRTERGQRKAEGGRAAVVRLADWLRRAGGVEAVAAVGFAVLPTGKP